MKNNSNEYNNFKELIDESKTDLSNYLEKRLLLAKLKIYEKIASASSYILYSLVAAVFALIFFILLLIGIGITLGEALQNYSMGFGILILIILLLFIFIVIFGKRVRRILINMTLRTIKKIEKDED